MDHLFCKNVPERLVSALRLAVKARPGLYDAYLRCVGRRADACFPSSATDLHLTGYPRSGNTFSANLTAALFPDLKVATHIHAISSLKLALKHEVATIVLIRDPSEAVPSAVIKRGGNGERTATVSALREYIWYYRYVEKNMQSLRVLDFRKLVADWSILVAAICDAVGNAPMPADVVETAVEEVTQRLKSDSRPAAQNTWHSEEKEALKDQVRERLYTLAEFGRAKALYDSLTCPQTAQCNTGSSQ